MRRTTRQCTEAAFFDEVFNKATELFLGLNTDDYPYLIPVNFAREGQCIYLHCALEGTKLDFLARDGRVGFSLAADVIVDPPKAATYYKSLCGTGHAVLLTDLEEKRHALDCIGARYAANCPHPAPDKVVQGVGVIRIDIVSLMGKRCLAE